MEDVAQTRHVLTLVLVQAHAHATVGMHRRPMMARTARRSTCVLPATVTVATIQYARIQGLVHAHVSAILTSGAMQTARTAKVSQIYSSLNLYCSFLPHFYAFFL